MNYFWIFRIDIMLVMQEAAQLYTFVPRDLSSWSMPVTWQMQQKGNDFEKLIMKVLWRRLTYVVMNWCSFPVWCIIIHQRLAACYLSTSFSCQLFLYKVTVRCQCQTLKKEWPCQDVQAAYQNSGRDPKDISKNHFGIGLLPCNSDCKSKVKVVDQELHLRKSKDLEVPFN